MLESPPTAQAESSSLPSERFDLSRSLEHNWNRRSTPNSKLLYIPKMATKSISSPVPDAWYPTLAVFMLSIGLVVTAFFFIYEATSSRKNRSLGKELGTGAVASVFLGFGTLFLLLASGIYV